MAANNVTTQKEIDAILDNPETDTIAKIKAFTGVMQDYIWKLPELSGVAGAFATIFGSASKKISRDNTDKVTTDSFKTSYDKLKAIQQWTGPLPVGELLLGMLQIAKIPQDKVDAKDNNHAAQYKEFNDFINDFYTKIAAVLASERAPASPAKEEVSEEDPRDAQIKKLEDIIAKLRADLDQQEGLSKAKATLFEDALDKLEAAEKEQKQLLEQRISELETELANAHDSNASSVDTLQQTLATQQNRLLAMQAEESARQQQAEARNSALLTVFAELHSEEDKQKLAAILGITLEPSSGASSAASIPDAPALATIITNSTSKTGGLGNLLSAKLLAEGRAGLGKRMRDANLPEAAIEKSLDAVFAPTNLAAAAAAKRREIRRGDTARSTILRKIKIEGARPLSEIAIPKESRVTIRDTWPTIEDFQTAQDSYLFVNDPVLKKVALFYIQKGNLEPIVECRIKNEAALIDAMSSYKTNSTVTLDKQAMKKSIFAHGSGGHTPSKETNILAGYNIELVSEYPQELALGVIYFKLDGDKLSFTVAPTNSNKKIEALLAGATQGERQITNAQNLQTIQSEFASQSLARKSFYIDFVNGFILANFAGKTSLFEHRTSLQTSAVSQNAGSPSSSSVVSAPTVSPERSTSPEKGKGKELDSGDDVVEEVKKESPSHSDTEAKRHSSSPVRSSRPASPVAFFSTAQAPDAPATTLADEDKKEGTETATPDNSAVRSTSPTPGSSSPR